MEKRKQPDDNDGVKKSKSGFQKRQEKAKESLGKAGHNVKQKKLSSFGFQPISSENPVSSTPEGTGTSESVDGEGITTAASDNLNLDSVRADNEVADVVMQTTDSLNSANSSFAPPVPTMVREFMALHPIQPSSIELSNLFKRKAGTLTIPRMWLSYNDSNSKFYCSICLAFTNTESTFRNGTNLNVKHGSTRVAQHENSTSHSQAVESWLRFETATDVSTLLNTDQRLLRNKQVQKNHLIVSRIIQWILYIARQGLAYRGSFESAKYLSEKAVNHGNFLEAILTAAESDQVLSDHVNKVIKLKDTGKGRGSKITFLSKTTINKLIELIAETLQQTIVKEVRKAKKFSVMLDSTQDISGHEQCSLVVRYVDFDQPIQEHLVSYYRISDTSGEGYFNLLMLQLSNLGLTAGDIIGCSFDGAGNMRSENVGLQARLKAINKDIIYTWCYAHVLNLVVCDTTTCVGSAKSLFGLLQMTYSFFSESTKRIEEWESAIRSSEEGPRKLIRLENMGKTRWYTKHKALKKLFCSYSEPQKGTYKALLTVLHKFKTDSKYDSRTSFEASALLRNWGEMTTILTALLFLKIFETLDSASSYLQTKGLDLFTAGGLIDSALTELKRTRNSFDELKIKAVSFAKLVNSVFASSDGFDIDVEEEIPQRRLKKVKMQHGELAPDEPINCPWENFKLKQFLPICDTVVSQIQNRYTTHRSQLEEIGWFHPTRFSKIDENNMPDLQIISEILNLDQAKLTQELQNFSTNFSLIMGESTNEAIGEDIESDTPFGSDSEDEEAKICMKKKLPCLKCVICCYKKLCALNLHTSTYSNLIQVYKFILSLPSTQVECERTHSKLKIIKNRLRASLNDEHVGALVLIYAERELAHNINLNEIIYKLANTSNELRRCLIE